MKPLIAALVLLTSAFFMPGTDFKNGEPTSRSPIKLTIATKQSTYKLPSPESKDDWFELSINCTVTNITDSTLTIVSPNAYRISPHPWIVKMNGRSAHQWPGDYMCAPHFTAEDKLEIKPNQKIHLTFQWHTFIANFEQTPGLKRFRLKYHLMEGAVVNRHTSDLQKDLKEIESDWSNEIKVEFEK